MFVVVKREKIEADKGIVDDKDDNDNDNDNDNNSNNVGVRQAYLCQSAILDDDTSPILPPPSPSKSDTRTQ